MFFTNFLAIFLRPSKPLVSRKKVLIFSSPRAATALLSEVIFSSTLLAWSANGRKIKSTILEFRDPGHLS